MAMELWPEKIDHPERVRAELETKTLKWTKIVWQPVAGRPSFGSS